MASPNVTWFGDTQLTGREAYGYKYAYAPADVREAPSPQPVYFGTTLTQPPVHTTPKRRLSQVYVPKWDGSVITYDDGYADTTQRYEFAFDLTHDPRAEDITALRAFEDAITGQGLDHTARWEWLIDTSDNAMLYAPRPALNIIGPTAQTSFYEHFGLETTVWARLGIYDGGGDILNQFGRTGRASITFRVKPVLCGLRQTYKTDPTPYDDSGTETTRDQEGAHYSLSLPGYYNALAPIIQWDGDLVLKRADSTQPIKIEIADNGEWNNAGCINLDADNLTRYKAGALGIGLDTIAGHVIAPPQYLDKTDPQGFGNLADRHYRRNIFFRIGNGYFTGTGHIYVSAVRLYTSLIC